MIKKIAVFVMALAVMALFFVFAVMREDEGTKMTDTFVVAGADAKGPMGTVQSTEAKALVTAFGAACPLPPVITSGAVTDTTVHMSAAREIKVTGEVLTIHGISPASAAPKIRPDKITFTPSDKAMFGLPVALAHDDTTQYVFLVTEDAAFAISLPRTDFDTRPDTLGALQMIQPQGDETP